MRRRGITLGCATASAACTPSSSHKWYFDELYDAVFVRPMAASGASAARVIETDFVQGVIVGGATGVVRAGTSLARAIQSGYLRAYALLLLFGVAARGPLLPHRELDDRSTCRSSSSCRWPPALVGALLPRAAGALGGARRHAWPCSPTRSSMLADFDSGAGGLHYVTDDEWISELGIRYQLGVDGLNLFLVLLTALAWVPCTLVAALPASGSARGSSSSTWRWPRPPCWARSSPRTWRCSSSSST